MGKQMRALYCWLFGHKSVLFGKDGGNQTHPTWRIKMLCERCETLRILKIKDTSTVAHERWLEGQKKERAISDQIVARVVGMKTSGRM